VDFEGLANLQLPKIPEWKIPQKGVPSPLLQQGLKSAMGWKIQEVADGE
jgi:hypothetical protein